jgi:hypothetical protein
MSQKRKRKPKAKAIPPKLPDWIIPPNRSTRYQERLTDILSHSSDVQHLYVGRAGELFVAAHLLRRGLNSAPLPVDTGVDLLAHGEVNFEVPLLQAEHELYQFQVKTTTINQYSESMPVRKVHDLWHKAINLVVVFWSKETAPSAVVLPPSLIRMLTSGGFEDSKSPLLATRNEVSLKVIESEGRYFIRNRNNEITAMRDGSTGSSRSTSIQACFRRMRTGRTARGWSHSTLTEIGPQTAEPRVPSGRSRESEGRP